MAVDMAMPVADPETDALASLEERIRRAVELVTALRSERDEALAAADMSRKAATAALAEVARLKEAVGEADELRREIDSLRGERQQVRGRIEKLLGQMDALSGQ